ncbi:Na-translocating system protein MpsC family protein [Desnuesiella massiliensis]|uniref:Na-translocating system protein MpsC family protein n=1 Tax=Desnuesiella massiliensis TaxID=1650662 RepID=UPI0006E2BE06|nr:Na-translocating system protein MpsC family protein [Desnuesiella massiliensis]
MGNSFRQVEIDIERYLAKQLKEWLGKRERQIKAKVKEDCLEVTIIGFLTPTEKILLRNPENEEDLNKVWTRFNNMVKDEIIYNIERILGYKIEFDKSNVDLPKDTKQVQFRILNRLSEEGKSSFNS